MSPIRDSITRTGARAPGVERLGPLARRCFTRASSLTQSGEYTVKAVGTRAKANQVLGKALSDSPALKPYRGKLAVRNFRGGDGNVGIIRSPVRAMALPDNRHGVANERQITTAGKPSAYGTRELFAKKTRMYELAPAQLRRVFGKPALGLLELGQIRVRVLPARQEILVCLTRFLRITGHGARPGKSVESVAALGPLL